MFEAGAFLDLPRIRDVTRCALESDLPVRRFLCIADCCHAQHNRCYRRAQKRQRNFPRKPRCRSMMQQEKHGLRHGLHSFE